MLTTKKLVNFVSLVASHGPAVRASSFPQTERQTAKEQGRLLAVNGLELVFACPLPSEVFSSDFIGFSEELVDERTTYTVSCDDCAEEPWKGHLADQLNLAEQAAHKLSLHEAMVVRSLLNRIAEFEGLLSAPGSDSVPSDRHYLPRISANSLRTTLHISGYWAATPAAVEFTRGK